MWSRGCVVDGSDCGPSPLVAVNTLILLIFAYTREPGRKGGREEETGEKGVIRTD